MLETKENTKDIIAVRKEQIEMSMRNHKQNTETQMVLGSVKNDTHAIKNKMGGYFFAIVAISFVVGIMLGTQYKTWSPFISDIYNAFKTARNVTR